MPEILQALGPHLGHQDRAACARVNRLWHHTFVPFLYEKVQSGMVLRGLELTADNARYVQELEMEVNGSSPRSDAAFVAHCKALQRLQMHIVWGEHWQGLLGLVRGNVRLRSLTVHLGTLVGVNHWDDLASVVAASGCRETLRELTLEDRFMRTTPPRVLHLLACIPNLEVLYCRGNSQEVSQVRSFAEEQQQQAQQPLQLQLQQLQQVQPSHMVNTRGRSSSSSSISKTFRLRSLELVETQSISLGMELLRILPALETARFHVEYGFHMDDFPTPSMATFCPRLHSIHLNHPIHLELHSLNEGPYVGLLQELVDHENKVARGIASCRRNSLEHMVLFEAYSGAASIGALIEHHCMSLRTLKLWHCQSSVTSAQFQLLLTRCPQLTELRLLGPMMRRGLTLQDAVREPWACTRLERLEIALHGVCHGNHKDGGEEEGEEEEDQAADAVVDNDSAEQLLEHQLQHHRRDHCRELEQQLYQQLGRLGHLKTLVIRAVSVVDGNRYREKVDTPSWSLERGLEAFVPSMPLEPGSPQGMAAHSLEVLDVRRTRHAITFAEIQWLQRHCPRLERLQGVLPFGTWERGEILGWTKQHWPGVRLS